MGRSIKSGNAEVRCEGDRVIVKGQMVTEGGEATGLTQAAADVRYVQRGGLAKLTVGADAPADPATNDLWIETD